MKLYTSTNSNEITRQMSEFMCFGMIPAYCDTMLKHIAAKYAVEDTVSLQIMGKSLKGKQIWRIRALSCFFNNDLQKSQQ